MTIDIIGGGIGGLTTAIALEKKGFKVRIYEQAPEIKQVGAGIILANNAMQVYQKLGLESLIGQNGNPINSMNITKANLSILNKIDLSFFEKKYQTKNFAIHRGILQKILLNNLKTTKIYLGHKLVGIDKESNGYKLKFENGKQVASSLIIGADGINSNVRNLAFPKSQIRRTNQICWRGVAQFQLPTKFQHELNEAWGKSDRFGFVQISHDKVYWYALKSLNKGSEFSINDLEKYFSNYNPLVNKIISLTKKEHINTAKISDLAPTMQWHNEHICLIGDAAHAMTPNMGQGACQAIEDAFVLSECLSKYEVKDAFAEYQKLRLPKAHQVVHTSWNIGRIAHLSNPILIRLRNQFMKWTPPSVGIKQNEKIFKLSAI